MTIRSLRSKSSRGNRSPKTGGGTVPRRKPSWFQRYVHRNYRLFSATRTWISRRFSKGGLVVLGAVVICAAQGDTTLSLTYQAFTFLSCLLMAALVGSMWSGGRFLVERRLPRCGSAGSPLAYRVILRNLEGRARRGLTVMENLPDPRPTLREFVDNPEPGEERRNWVDRTYGYYRWRWLTARNRRAEVPDQGVSFLPPHGQVEIRFEMMPLRRGPLWLDRITIANPDPLGLFRRLIRLPLPQSLLILPKRYALPPIALPGVMKYQPGGVALASSVGESQEFVALRDYRPGDPLRHVHWPSWAKTGRPIVKEFQDEFFVRHALILDTFGEKDYSDLFEEAVSVAASFACSLRTQESLLDLMFVGPQAYCFTTGRGLAHQEQMLEVLASVRVCRDQPFRLLSHLVMQHAAAVSGCVCILLAWDIERQRFIEQLCALGVPLLTLVIVEPGTAPALEPGPMRRQPGNFHVLERGQIAEALSRIKSPAGSP